MINQPRAQPYKLEGSKEALLLVHGFTGTPAELRPVAELASSKFGWTAQGLRLKGHGTTPADLEEAKLEDWDRQVEEAYQALTENHDSVHLVGMSLGSILCLRLTQRAVVQPKSQSLLVPAVYLANPWKELVLDLFRLPPVYWLKPRSKKKNIPDGHLTYSYYPTKALPQLKRALRWSQALPEHLWPPTLICGAGKDETIHRRSVPFLMERMKESKLRHIELENAGHIVTLASEKHRLFETLEDFWKSL